MSLFFTGPSIFGALTVSLDVIPIEMLVSLLAVVVDATGVLSLIELLLLVFRRIDGGLGRDVTGKLNKSARERVERGR